MSRLLLLFTLPLIMLPAIDAAAHAIDHRIDTRAATVLSICYADGSPFSFESYEIRSPENSKPFQVGRTDRLGRVVLLPDRPGPWSVKVFADDGHGLQTTIDITDDPMAVVEDQTGPDRLTGILGGLLLIAVLALVLQNEDRRKSR